MLTQMEPSADVFLTNIGQENPIPLEEQVQEKFKEIGQQCPDSDDILPTLGGTRPSCYIRDNKIEYTTYTELTMELTTKNRVAEMCSRLQHTSDDYTAARMSLVLGPRPSILILTGRHIINNEILEIKDSLVLTYNSSDYKVALAYLLELADRYIELSKVVNVLRDPVIVAG